jgi:hypothetical protein
MNNQQLGAARDRLTIDTLTAWGVMDTDQLQILLFPSYRVAQRRLSKLVEQKRIKRCTQTVPYSYHVDFKGDVLTRINQNWVRLWLMKTLKSGFKIVDFDYKTYTVYNEWKKETKVELVPEYREKMKEEVKCVK